MTSSRELLSRAEVNADQSPASEQVPTPDEEIHAVLPEEVLSALDAPLEGDDAEDEVEGPSRVTTSGGRSATTGVREPVQDHVIAPRAASVPPEPLTSDGHGASVQTQGAEPMSTVASTGIAHPRRRHHVASVRGVRNHHRNRLAPTRARR